jgi:hypothetical protein
MMRVVKRTIQRLSHSLISFVAVELKVLREEEGSDVEQTLLVETTAAR